MSSTYNLLSLLDNDKASPGKMQPMGVEQSSGNGSKVAEQSSNFQSLLSCGAYSLCSVGMVIANKAISSSIPEEERVNIPQLSVICFQCLVGVVFVEICKRIGYVEYPDFEWKTARAWLPLNILFIGMLATGFLALVHNNIPMVTVFKNLTNVLTIFGDYVIFGQPTTLLTILSVAVMVLGAALAGSEDLQFSLLGYTFMGLNCLFTSGYVLYMRYAITNVRLPKFGMVFYNNLLSVLLLVPAILLTGELPQLYNEAIMTHSFIFNNVLAGFLGFYLNFASLWCVGSTSASTYAIVGTVNKVPITILGFIMFDAKITQEGVLFIGMATLGGFLYAYSKFQESKK